MSQYTGNDGRPQNRSRSRDKAGTGSVKTGSARKNVRYSKNKKKGFPVQPLILLSLTAIAGLTLFVVMTSGKKDAGTDAAKSQQEASVSFADRTDPEETLEVASVKVDGLDISSMSAEEAEKALTEKYGWNMKVKSEDGEYELDNILTKRIEELIDEIYSASMPEEEYTLDLSGLDDEAASLAAAVAEKVNVKAKNGSISGYNAENDSFVFSGAEPGRNLDEEALAKDIADAVKSGDFDAVLSASVETVTPEFDEAEAKEKYRTVSTFTTNTTANEKRNTNVKLAARAINGTVLAPGEEFSFNNVVGKRTAAGGYQEAGAYSNGEVVQEVGGGVCQVSSTLYNAVVKAGLRTTSRKSHTFEPTYVTPGTDATVSWGGPDYKFINNSSTSIGIRASYANRQVTVSIYAIPLLESGVTYSLSSEKKKDTGLPEPIYEEDPTLEPGVEETSSKGTSGSIWETRLVIQKDGTVTSRELDHTSTYKGHNPVIRRNTSGTVAASETTVAESESGQTEAQTTKAQTEAAETTVAGPAGSSQTSGKTSGSGTVIAPGAEKPTGADPGNTTGQTSNPVSAPTAAATTQAAATEAASSAPTAAASGAVETLAPFPGN